MLSALPIVLPIVLPSVPTWCAAAVCLW